MGRLSQTLGLAKELSFRAGVQSVMTTWNLASVSVCVSIIFLIWPQNGFSCSCGSSIPAEAIADASNVFIGIPVASRRLPSGGLFDGPQVSYRFRVLWVFKGAGKISEIITEESSAACGSSFILGMPYFAYAYSERKFLETNSCTRTRSFPLAGPDFLEAMTGINLGTGSFYVGVGLLFSSLLVLRRVRRKGKSL